MPAVWPPTLPQIVHIRNYQETPAKNTIRTPMEVGPPKMRRRTTSGPVRCEISFSFTTEEVAILDDFYVNTLLSGSQTFEWKHPRNQAQTKIFQFDGEPVYSVSGDHRDWTVTLPLLMVA